MGTRSSRASKALAVFLALLLFFGAVLLVSNFYITTTTYTFSYSYLPEAFDGFRIVQLSDLHSRSFGHDNDYLLKEVERASPDIVVLTGDMINTTDSNFSVFLRLAERLCAAYEVYFIVGNHEQGNLHDLTPLYESLRLMGVTILDNGFVPLEHNGAVANLYGLWFNLRYYRNLNDPHSAGYYFDLDSMQDILGPADPDRFDILLTHNPVYFDTYTAWGADLTLTGHMHGGMLRIPFVGAVFSPEMDLFPEYDAGVFSKGQQRMVVNRGLGNGLAGIRFWNCPEVGVIVLKKGE